MQTHAPTTYPTITRNITSYASINNLSNTTVQISDGKLKFADTKIPEPLTFKYLEKTLTPNVRVFSFGTHPTRLLYLRPD